MTFPISKNATDKLFQLNFLSDTLALFFGLLVIFLNFGDDHTGPTIGNLDTVFGLRFWPFVDVIVLWFRLLFFWLMAGET